MSTIEKINQSIKKLSKNSQIEVLNFIEFLLSKSGIVSDDYDIEDWNQFSLNQAMKGLEDEKHIVYHVSDLKEKYME